VASRTFMFPASGRLAKKPKPLTSVDDALRLVLEGWTTLDVMESEKGWKWSLTKNLKVCRGTAPTAARALTIAILRTKETPSV